MAWLDDNGLLYVWSKIKSTFVAKESGKGLSTNDYTTAEKNKLVGIATGATKNTVEDVLTSTSNTNALSANQGYILDGKIRAVSQDAMKKEIYDVDGDGIVDKAKDADNASTVNGFTVQKTVPSNAKFSDTKYEMEFANSSSDGTALLVLVETDEYNGNNEAFIIPINNATTEKAGAMSAYDKTKLDNLENTYAKKSDITGVYKYKGSVTSASNLPTSGQTKGDVYNIESASAYGGAGANVAWDGSKWDTLGEIFTITAITNSELDTICV